MLFPGQAKPLHEQLKDAIKLKITNAEIKPGDLLPSERHLIDLYKVSRVTVRQALGALVNEGLLYRQHGKGTFVAPSRFERPLARLLGVVEELRLDNLEIEINLLSQGFLPTSELPPEVQIFDDKPIFHVTRLITSEAQPLLIDRRYFPKTVGQFVQNLDLSKDTILVQLELYGFKIVRGTQKISAEQITVENAKLLQCAPGNPVLVAKRTTFVEGDIPIDYSCTLYRADRYEYLVDLRRNTPIG